MSALIFQAVLSGLGFIFRFFGAKDEQLKWLAKTAETLSEKGWVRNEFILKLEQDRRKRLYERMDQILSEKQNLVGEVETEMKKVKREEISYVPALGDRGDAVAVVQLELNRASFSPGEIDGVFGHRTKDAISKFQKSIGLRGSGIIGPKTLAGLKITLVEPKRSGKNPPWYDYAKKFSGKKETDPKFAKFMIPKWKLVGLDLKRIDKKWAAWCGLAMAVALSGVGLNYSKKGAAAKNWAKFGVAIEWKTHGIPRGAIIHINKRCGSGSGNHVTQADGDCTAKDLLKKGATINGYGGNQGNRWKVSTYPVSRICAVRWPKDYPYPPRVLKSERCTSGKSKDESTR
jgi:hypothetical protein